MTILFEKKRILISDLTKIPFVNIFDQNENFAENPKTGIIETTPYKQMASVFFNATNYKNKLKQKFNDFKDEVNSNRLISAINLYQYISEIKTEFSVLKGNYSKFLIHTREFIWRMDARIFYNADYPEDITVKNIEIFPLKTVIIISRYFVFQQDVINDSLLYLESLLPKKQTGNYGTTYQYNYFQFESLDHIGDDDEIQEKKLEFCKDLANQGLIEPSDFKALLDYFHNLPSKSKIKWKGTREELNYLINGMVDNHIIVNTKRMRPHIIAKVFCDKHGNEITFNMFDGLQKPTKTNKIDNVLSILKHG